MPFYAQISWNSFDRGLGDSALHRYDLYIYFKSIWSGCVHSVKVSSESEKLSFFLSGFYNAFSPWWPRIEVYQRVPVSHKWLIVLRHDRNASACRQSPRPPPGTLGESPASRLVLVLVLFFRIVWPHLGNDAETLHFITCILDLAISLARAVS